MSDIRSRGPSVVHCSASEMRGILSGSRLQWRRRASGLPALKAIASKKASIKPPLRGPGACRRQPNVYGCGLTPVFSYVTVAYSIFGYETVSVLYSCTLYPRHHPLDPSMLVNPVTPRRPTLDVPLDPSTPRPLDVPLDTPRREGIIESPLDPSTSPLDPSTSQPLDNPSTYPSNPRQPGLN